MSVTAQLFLMSLALAGAGALYFHRVSASAQRKYGNPPADAPADDTRRASRG